MDVQDINLKLNAINGQFFPGQMSARLFMEEKDIKKKYLTLFHERFHYLQYIFTPYGHLKWGANRTYTSDVVTTWLGSVTHQKKIPSSNYFEDDDIDSLSIAASIYMHDLTKRFSDITEGVNFSKEEADLLSIDLDQLLPKVEVDSQEYILNGLDIIESFAKYEEAVFAYLVEGKELTEIIDPNRLSPRYYIALYYFVDELGNDRIEEFPIVCELALSFSKLPRPKDEKSLYANHPSWRFLKIISVLKNNPGLKLEEFSTENYYKWTNSVLDLCGYEKIESVWQSAKDYASSSDLSMSIEMLHAIQFKTQHPWCLSYPFMEFDLFVSEEFERFYPLFMITENRVYYNVEHVDFSELLFENEYQALALQISGHISRSNIYPDMLQCADNYFEIKSCKYWTNNECDGHIDKHCILPNLKLDQKGNIIEGCYLEVILNILGTSIREIEVSDIRKKYSFSEINDRIKELYR